MKIYKGDRLPDLERHMVAIDSIFFESSAKQEFADQAERDAFRERWLGRYIEKHRDSFFVAIDDDGNAIGYLAGCAALDDAALARAIIYGSTLASFAVEDFSIDRLLRLNADEIAERFGLFRRLTYFDEE